MAIDHVRHEHDEQGNITSTQYFYVCTNKGNGMRAPCVGYLKAATATGAESETQIVPKKPEKPTEEVAQ